MSSRDPYAVFRPRRGPLVARLSALAVLLVFGGMALLEPGSWGLPDRLLTIGLALLGAAGLWRFGMVRAIPTHEGLTVINLVYRHHLEWPQIVRVNTFSGGSPWVVLELTDTETLSVMGIQRADGAFAASEAARLAALVHHSR